MQEKDIFFAAGLAVATLFAAPVAIAQAVASTAAVPLYAEADDPLAEGGYADESACEDQLVAEPVLVDTQAVAEAAAAAKAVEEAKLEAAAREKSEAEAKEEAKLERRRISTRIFRLANANAEEVADRFNATWSGEFGTTWKVSKIAQAFPEANSVMVTAPAMILDACEKVVEDIDVEVPQVYIEARFIELSNNASHKLGIDWQMFDGMKGSLALDAGLNQRNLKGVSSYTSADGTYAISSNGDSSSANLSYVNGTLGMSELYVILRALEASEDARTFSNPKIIVSSGKKANIDMTTKYPNVKISAKRTTNSGGDSLDLDMQMASIPGEDKLMFANEAFFSWGISLDVTPRISSNGLINVQIVPTISSRSDWVVAGTLDESSDSGTISAKYPVIDVQRLVTEFNMSSGTTAVIGGLSVTVETQKDNGIPWLRDWWWIGPKLFGSKVRVKEQREIVVFVTVGIVDPRNIKLDAGLPKNAVLGRQYTDDVRREPGDRKRMRTEGMKSLDMRSLEEQYADPRRTNRVEKAEWSLGGIPLPFTKDPNYTQNNERQ